MEAMIGSSSSSSRYLKLVSCRDNYNKLRFLCMKVDHFFIRSPLHYSHINLAISLSSSSRKAVRPISVSSTHIQAEVENDDALQIQHHSLNGYTSKPEAQTPTQTVRVAIQLQRECSFGHNFRLVGDDPMLGLWDPNDAIPLTWSDGHVWTVDLDIPIGKCIKFKFIMQESNGTFMWQPGPDRILECYATHNIITVSEDWENPDSRRIVEVEPSLNHAQVSVQMVAANEEMLVVPSVSSTQIEEPETGMKSVLESDDRVPVLVPGLSELPSTNTNEKGSSVPKDEPEAMNGAAVVSMDLKLPELSWIGDANTSISNPRPVILIHESQEMPQVVEEQDHRASQPMTSSGGKNIFQKLLNVLFGIQ